MDDRASRGRREFLVILEGERAAQALDRIRAGHRVAQEASPRVVVVEGAAPDEEARMRAIPGVRAVIAGGDLAPESIEGLDEGDVLFARAWVHRMKGAKRRRSEGLPWDAPGLEPPDLPTARSRERDQ